MQYTLGALALLLLVLPAKVVLGGVGLATFFNFGSVNFNGDEVHDIAKVIVDKTYGHPKMTQFHTVVSGVVTDMQVVYAGIMSKLTKADAGCGTGAVSTGPALRQKTVSPKQVKVWQQLCADELDGSLMVYAQKKGTDVSNIIGTKIEGFIVDSITPAMLEDAFRIIWFNDTTHTNVGAGSGTEQIKVGVSTTDYTMIDGLWKQIFAIVAADANRRVTITENAGANYAAQDNLSATAARDYYRDLLTKADYRLQGAENKIILSTVSLINNYADYLESQGVDASFKRLESGFVTLQRRGVTIIGWDFWDRTIRADIQNGTKYFSPHRAVLTTPENLGVYIDNGEGALSDIEIWYDQTEEMNNFRAKYKIDAKIAVDYMIEAAY